MASGKKSFMFYCDWKETFESLPNEKAGELIKHVLRYVNDENPQTDDILIKAVFANIKATLKRDLKKWEKIVERNRKNGALGGRPPGTQQNPDNPVGFLGTQINPEKPDNDNDSDSDKAYKDIWGEKEFLETWKKAREGYLKKPTNIPRLQAFEKQNLKQALTEYTPDEIKSAIHGLFKQENKTIKSMYLTPSHFLENITKYYNAEISKEYELYGKAK